MLLAAQSIVHPQGVCIITMKGAGNIRSCHLNLFPLNGGEQDTLPSTVSGKVGIKLNDQLCVGSGGDWLEELL